MSLNIELSGVNLNDLLPKNKYPGGTYKIGTNFNGDFEQYISKLFNYIKGKTGAKTKDEKLEAIESIANEMASIHSDTPTEWKPAISIFEQNLVRYFNSHNNAELKSDESRKNETENKVSPEKEETQGKMELPEYSPAVNPTVPTSTPTPTAHKSTTISTTTSITFNTPIGSNPSPPSFNNPQPHDVNPPAPTVTPVTPVTPTTPTPSAPQPEENNPPPSGNKRETLPAENTRPKWPEDPKERSKAGVEKERPSYKGSDQLTISKNIMANYYTPYTGSSRIFRFIPIPLRWKNMKTGTDVTTSEWHDVFLDAIYFSLPDNLEEVDNVAFIEPRSIYKDMFDYIRNWAFDNLPPLSWLIQWILVTKEFVEYIKNGVDFDEWQTNLYNVFEYLMKTYKDSFNFPSIGDITYRDLEEAYKANKVDAAIELIKKGTIDYSLGRGPRPKIDVNLIPKTLPETFGEADERQKKYEDVAEKRAKIWKEHISGENTESKTTANRLRELISSQPGDEKPSSIQQQVPSVKLTSKPRSTKPTANWFKKFAKERNPLKELPWEETPEQTEIKKLFFSRLKDTDDIIAFPFVHTEYASLIKNVVIFPRQGNERFITTDLELVHIFSEMPPELAYYNEGDWLVPDRWEDSFTKETWSGPEWRRLFYNRILKPSITGDRINSNSTNEFFDGLRSRLTSLTGDILPPVGWCVKWSILLDAIEYVYRFPDFYYTHWLKLVRDLKDLYAPENNDFNLYRTQIFVKYPSDGLHKDDYKALYKEGVDNAAVTIKYRYENTGKVLPIGSVPPVSVKQTEFTELPKKTGPFSTEKYPQSEEALEMQGQQQVEQQQKQREHEVITERYSTEFEPLSTQEQTRSQERRERRKQPQKNRFNASVNEKKKTSITSERISVNPSNNPVRKWIKQRSEEIRKLDEQIGQVPGTIHRLRSNPKVEAKTETKGERRPKGRGEEYDRLRQQESDLVEEYEQIAELRARETDDDKIQQYGQSLNRLQGILRRLRDDINEKFPPSEEVEESREKLEGEYEGKTKYLPEYQELKEAESQLVEESEQLADLQASETDERKKAELQEELDTVIRVLNEIHSKLEETFPQEIEQEKREKKMEGVIKPIRKVKRLTYGKSVGTFIPSHPSRGNEEADFSSIFGTAVVPVSTGNLSKSTQTERSEISTQVNTDIGEEEFQGGEGQGESGGETETQQSEPITEEFQEIEIPTQETETSTQETEIPTLELQTTERRKIARQQRIENIRKSQYQRPPPTRGSAERFISGTENQTADFTSIWGSQVNSPDVKKHGIKKIRRPNQKPEKKQQPPSIERGESSSEEEEEEERLSEKTSRYSDIYKSLEESQLESNETPIGIVQQPESRSKLSPPPMSSLKKKKNAIVSMGTQTDVIPDISEGLRQEIKELRQTPVRGSTKFFRSFYEQTFATPADNPLYPYTNLNVMFNPYIRILHDANINIRDEHLPRKYDLILSILPQCMSYELYSGDTLGISLLTAARMQLISLNLEKRGSQVFMTSRILRYDLDDSDFTFVTAIEITLIAAFAAPQRSVMNASVTLNNIFFHVYYGYVNYTKAVVILSNVTNTPAIIQKPNLQREDFNAGDHITKYFNSDFGGTSDNTVSQISSDDNIIVFSSKTVQDSEEIFMFIASTIVVSTYAMDEFYRSNGPKLKRLPFINHMAFKNMLTLIRSNPFISAPTRLSLSISLLLYPTVGAAIVKQILDESPSAPVIKKRVSENALEYLVSSYSTVNDPKYNPFDGVPITQMLQVIKSATTDKKMGLNKIAWAMCKNIFLGVGNPVYTILQAIDGIVLTMVKKDPKQRDWLIEPVLSTGKTITDYSRNIATETVRQFAVAMKHAYMFSVEAFSLVLDIFIGDGTNTGFTSFDKDAPTKSLDSLLGGVLHFKKCINNKIDTDIGTVNSAVKFVSNYYVNALYLLKTGSNIIGLLPMNTPDEVVLFQPVVFSELDAGFTLPSIASGKSKNTFTQIIGNIGKLRNDEKRAAYLLLNEYAKNKEFSKYFSLPETGAIEIYEKHKGVFNIPYEVLLYKALTRSDKTFSELFASQSPDKTTFNRPIIFDYLATKSNERLSKPTGSNESLTRNFARFIETLESVIDKENPFSNYIWNIVKSLDPYYFHCHRVLYTGILENNDKIDLLIHLILSSPRIKSNLSGFPKDLSTLEYFNNAYAVIEGNNSIIRAENLVGQTLNGTLQEMDSARLTLPNATGFLCTKEFNPAQVEFWMICKNTAERYYAEPLKEFIEKVEVYYRRIDALKGNISIAWGNELTLVSHLIPIHFNTERKFEKDKTFITLETIKASNIFKKKPDAAISLSFLTLMMPKDDPVTGYPMYNSDVKVSTQWKRFPDDFQKIIFGYIEAVIKNTLLGDLNDDEFAGDKIGILKMSPDKETSRHTFIETAANVHSDLITVSMVNFRDKFKEEFENMVVLDNVRTLTKGGYIPFENIPALNFVADIDKDIAKSDIEWIDERFGNYFPNNDGGVMTKYFQKIFKAIVVIIQPLLGAIDNNDDFIALTKDNLPTMRFKDNPDDYVKSLKDEISNLFVKRTKELDDRANDILRKNNEIRTRLDAIQIHVLADLYASVIPKDDYNELIMNQVTSLAGSDPSSPKFGETVSLLPEEITKKYIFSFAENDVQVLPPSEPVNVISVPEVENLSPEAEVPLTRVEEPIVPVSEEVVPEEPVPAEQVPPTTNTPSTETSEHASSKRPTSFLSHGHQSKGTLIKKTGIRPISHSSFNKSNTVSPSEQPKWTDSDKYTSSTMWNEGIMTDNGMAVALTVTPSITPLSSNFTPSHSHKETEDNGTRQYYGFKSIRKNH